MGLMIWKEDLVLCNPSSQSLRTPSRPSKRSLMSEEWERNEHRSYTSRTTIITSETRSNPLNLSGTDDQLTFQTTVKELVLWYFLFKHELISLIVHKALSITKEFMELKK